MEEKPMSFEQEVGNIKIKASLPESAFEQQDLYVLLMCWHKEHSVELWGKIRNIAIAHSEFKDSIGVKLQANELPLEALDVLMNKYVEMAIDFFTSRLA